MSMMKKLLDDTAARMGIIDPNDPRVVAEADRQLMTDRLCGICCHWIEEHTKDGCEAPGCECPGFQPITDPNDPLHIEELEARAMKEVQ
jgi:hypothetical protein